MFFFRKSWSALQKTELIKKKKKNFRDGKKFLVSSIHKERASEVPILYKFF